MYVDPNIVLFAIATLNCITAALTWRTHTATIKTQRDIAIVEKATNSITDRLVSVTKSEAHAAGIKEEKDRTVL